jgi:hypothetical protein
MSIRRPIMLRGIRGANRNRLGPAVAWFASTCEARNRFGLDEISPGSLDASLGCARSRTKAGENR